MTLPGTITKDIESNVVTAPSVDTATSFIAGLAERGPVGVAMLRRTQAQFEATFGAEVAYGYLHDAARLIPKEEGSDQYYSRVVGPAAKAASVKFVDGTEANTMEVLAANPGEWGNNLKGIVSAVEGGSFTVTVQENGVAKESERFTTVAEAHAWALKSAYIRINDLGGADPVAAEKALTAGTDDRASITDVHRAGALAAFTADLGPGQVAFPGGTTKALRTSLLEHAKATNRVVVPDAVDTHTVATLTGATAELASLDSTLLRCGFKPFGPWVEVAGAAQGVTKIVPPSILVMAAIARHDGETFNTAAGVNNPNDPAAGVNGILRTALGLSQEAWNDVERETLNDEAINVIRVVYGQVRIYGYRTLANPLTDPLHEWGNNRRIDMAIKAKGQVIAEEVVLGAIDSKGNKLGAMAGALKAEVLDPYVKVGALFELPGQAGSAYSLDVGEDVNPLEELFAGKARALVMARRAPLAEMVEIDYLVEGVS